jgi:hypothetical protein
VDVVKDQKDRMDIQVLRVKARGNLKPQELIAEKI